MADANPNILSHISLGTNQFDQAVAFYDQVLPTLGCKRILAHPGAVAYGRDYPEFWVQAPIDGQPASVGNGTHFGFVAPDKAAVHAFYATALAAGASDDG
jgi:catechol 2,3-dioxygenase-like lactoylglutathione lyase family enzyme